MTEWTHDALCWRALRWLHGTRRCEPVFNNIASCSEIPDAIGWSSSYGWTGSTVVECKTSMSDFHADKNKYWQWRKDDRMYGYPFGRLTKKEALEGGYRAVELSKMGNYRFFLCETGLIPESAIKEHAPDHGLLYCKGNSLRVIIPAPLRKRDLIDFDSEIRYLRFAIINNKKRYPYEQPESVPNPQLALIGDET